MQKNETRPLSYTTYKKSVQREGIYVYGWFMLRFDRKQWSSVKQLSFNKKNKLKINTSGFKDLHIRSEATKFLEENIGGNLNNLCFSNVFCEWLQRQDQMKLLQTENFHIVKEIIIKMPRQHAELKKIFASHTSDKGLISKNI